MGTLYQLVNITQKEIIYYMHIPAAKARELAGNPVSASITTWYLLTHLGNQITFVSTKEPVWPYDSGSINDVDEFTEVTDQIVDELIKNHILVDEGKTFYFDDEPEIYDRKLKNIWMEYRGPI